MRWMLRPCLALAGALVAAGCATRPHAVYAAALGPSYAQGVDYSDFLAARFSALTGDHQAAAHYFRRAAQTDPDDPKRLDRAVVSSILALQTFEAAALAREAPRKTRAAAPFSVLVLAADEVWRGRRSAAREILTESALGPVNDDIAAVLVAWLGKDLAPEQLTARETIRAADRARILDMMAAAGGSVRAGAGERLSREGGMAASVLLLAHEQALGASRELQLFYAALALHLDPNHEPAQFALAQALTGMDRDAEAALVLGGVPPGSPRFAEAVVTRAELEVGLAAPASAERLLREVAWPAQPRDLRLRAGDLYRTLDRLVEAEALFADVVRADAVAGAIDWRPFLARADVLRRLGRWEEAEQDLQTALRAAPDEPLVLNDVGYAWVERGENLPVALGLLQRAASLRPDDASVLDSLGWAYAQTGDYAAAVACLERAAALAPTRASILDHLGEVYSRLGRTTDAAYEWRRALASGPDAPLAERIRLKLANDAPKASPHSEAQADAASPGLGLVFETSKVPVQ